MPMLFARSKTTLVTNDRDQQEDVIAVTSPYRACVAPEKAFDQATFENELMMPNQIVRGPAPPLGLFA